MNDYLSPDAFNKKSSALKHLNKLIAKIDKSGKADVPLNCTGVILTIVKNDPIYLKFCTIKAQLTEELNSYAIVKQEILKRRKQLSFASR